MTPHDRLRSALPPHAYLEALERVTRQIWMPFGTSRTGRRTAERLP